MREYITTHIQIALILLLLIIAIITGLAVAHFRQAAAVESIQTLLRAQEARMLTLAEITDRNGADEIIKKILTDCSERGTFENLLGNLATLNKKDLLVTQSLFEGCGTFESEQKALMVGKLEREFLVYKDLHALLEIFLSDTDASKDNESTWQELVHYETLRSTLLHDLAGMQSDIINAFVQGAHIESNTIRTLAADAKNISDLLSLYDQKIDALREHAVVMQ